MINLSIDFSIIDTKEKLNFVMDIGIDFVQGEYFSRPIENIDMLRTRVQELIEEAQDEPIISPSLFSLIINGGTNAWEVK